MITFYIILVAMLLSLAIFDLFVGVSNDAVNFLNSAIGSKAFRMKQLLIFASLGVLVGAAFSNGMMDIARHGILQPSFYTFAQVLNVFIAVMLTDVIILNMFNTLGFPTSTTVSMVFELLGGAVAMAALKVFYLNEPNTLGSLINTEKALSVILGIFLSVAIAFTVGTLVQYITRLIFSFAYKKNLKYFIGLFGGVALTSVCYFILIKGVKNLSFVTPEYKAFLSNNETLLLLVLFGIFFLLSHFLHLVKVNVLKVIVAIGTFALALAFASNDLVNFVGVPLTGLSSLQHLLGAGADPETFNMAFLMEKHSEGSIYLVVAGAIMVLALCFSKKAKNVVKTSVSLSSQNTNDEIFGTNPVARALVRSSHKAGKWMSDMFPEKLKGFLNKRFNTSEITLEEPDAAFDLLRASVNIMLASSLIALGTSLKLPLSTTYVTFMVAMGSSLADRAWSRETAAYRITGVLSVIGGWFFTAFAAFSVCGIVTVGLYFGGFPAKFVLFAIVIFILVRSNFKKEDELKKEENKFEWMVREAKNTSVFPLIKEHSQKAWSQIVRFEFQYYQKIIQSFLREDLGKLRSVHKEIKLLRKNLEVIRRQSSLCSEKLRQEDLVVKNFFLYQVNDFFNDSIFSLKQISSPCKDFVDNHFSPFSNNKRKILLRLVADLEEVFESLAQMIETQNFENYNWVRSRLSEIGNDALNFRKKEMMRTSQEKVNVRSEMVYLTILYETKSLLDAMGSIAKSSRKFMTDKAPKERAVIPNEV